MIESMNSKMTTNSQLSTTAPKQTNKQTKQTRTGTESQECRLHGGLSGGRMGEKAQGISSINGRYKTDRGG